jgi:hypothetical protein
MIKEAILMSGINEKEHHQLSTFNIYPNPNQGSFWIEFEAEKNGNTEIKVHDIMGKTIFENTQPSQMGLNKIEIKHPNLNPGIYVLKLKYNGAEISKRLVVN